MSNRFFSETPSTTDAAVLAGSEAHHLARVMRARIGDTVVLFDGSGAECVARIERITKAAVELRIEERREVDRELPFRLTLAVALPKGDRQRWLVEKAVELGVSRLVPLVTTRGVADGRAVIDRLRRAVIEASKQCGRNRLMEIHTPRHWRDVAGDSGKPDLMRFFAHPTVSETVSELTGDAVRLASDVTVAVGPEGGWTDDEVELARAHAWRFVDLGPRILRVETAAIALAITVIHQRGSWPT